MVKMGGGLGRPIPMQREIRQGCPISGQLYSLGIEPLLCKLREWVSGLSMPGSLSLGHPPHVVSAYADDINIFVTSQGDEQHLRETLDMFQNASSAQVNWSKSEALLVGPWRDQVAPSHKYIDLCSQCLLVTEAPKQLFQPQSTNQPDSQLKTLSIV